MRIQTTKPRCIGKEEYPSQSTEPWEGPAAKGGLSAMVRNGAEHQDKGRSDSAQLMGLLAEDGRVRFVL